jgi:hypothetical protein
MQGNEHQGQQNTVLSGPARTSNLPGRSASVEMNLVQQPFAAKGTLPLADEPSERSQKVSYNTGSFIKKDWSILPAAD